ncbi:MAG: hypothetical protein U5L09_04765 [Bacteroidales bacterium]|nr:hypothetical protein [Bacteroidales bacterium]
MEWSTAFCGTTGYRQRQRPSQNHPSSNVVKITSRMLSGGAPGSLLHHSRQIFYFIIHQLSELLSSILPCCAAQPA